MKRLWCLISLTVITIDQAVKYFIRHSYELGESTKLIDGLFSVTYVRNHGAAFSIMSGERAVLTVIPLVVVALGVCYILRHPKEHFTMYLSGGLLTGGGFSNLIDRAMLGYVTDMFDLQFWPVFNVADIAIVAGCGILVVYILFYFDSKKRDNRECDLR